MYTNRILVRHEGVVEEAFFNGANFSKEMASIGLVARRLNSKSPLKFYAYFTFCDPIDKFNRTKAMETIAHRILSKKRKIVNKMCIATLPASTIFSAEMLNSYSKRVFDAFEAACIAGNAKYKLARDNDSYPLPDRAGLIRSEFGKRVAKVSVKISKKKEMQLA